TSMTARRSTCDKKISMRLRFLQPSIVFGFVGFVGFIFGVACTEETKKTSVPAPSSAKTSTISAKPQPTALAMYLFAIDADGRERPLDNGASVKITERLRFAYQTPPTSKKSIVLLGLDEKGAHWYFPTSPDGAPLPI